MVSYLVIKTHPKTSVMIDRQVFEDIINSLAKSVSDIKINTFKTSITFLKKENNVNLSLEIKISKNVKIADKVKEIKNKIESHCLYLTNFKPQNIIINYVGSY